MIQELKRKTHQCVNCNRNISYPKSDIWVGLRTGWVYIRCEHCGYDNKIGNDT